MREIPTSRVGVLRAGSFPALLCVRLLFAICFDSCLRQVDRPLIKNRAFSLEASARPARTKVKKAGGGKGEAKRAGKKDLVLGQLSTLFDD